jgi:hypothetical protein
MARVLIMRILCSALRPIFSSPQWPINLHKLLLISCFKYILYYIRNLSINKITMLVVR